MYVMVELVGSVFGGGAVVFLFERLKTLYTPVSHTNLIAK